MTDIVEKLRAPLGVMQCEVSCGPAPENKLERRWLLALEAAAEIERLRAALEEAIEFVDQAEMALTPRGEAYVARWRAAIDGQSAPSESHLAPDHQAAMHGALRRSVSVVQPAPSGWRPIETAPKDGTQFLTWDSHYGIRVGRCVVRPDHDDWLSYMDAYKGSSKGGIRATHWMPLPPAPGKEVA